MAQSNTKIIDSKRVNTASDLLYTPVGTFLVECSEKGVIKCQLSNAKVLKRSFVSSRKSQKILALTLVQLTNYFEKKSTKISLPVDLSGTEFQTKTWKKLSKVPFGKTISYQQLAIDIKNPKAQRAIGGAVNNNPLMIIIPCHRVISKNGSLGGFALPLRIKKWLLQHERELGVNDEDDRALRH